jgi:hypothetical protein
MATFLMIQMTEGIQNMLNAAYSQSFRKSITGSKGEIGGKYGRI